MDNSYILLLILKLKINVGCFIEWFIDFCHTNNCEPSYDDYKKFHLYLSDGVLFREFNGHTYIKHDLYDFGNSVLNDFEYNYFVSYLRLRNFI